MAVNDVLSQLQALIQGTSGRLISVTDQPKETFPFVPGERYTARVEQQLANGRFLVFIRDQTLDLNLPRNTQPGQTVDLRFVAREPRLTFVLAEEPTAGRHSTPVNLSDGSRYLNALLDRVRDLALRQMEGASAGAPRVAAGGGGPAGPGAPQVQTTPLQHAKPLVEGALPPATQFAALLREAVTRSGLFYESHQAAWVAGERSLADLLREPQGRLSQPQAFAASGVPPEEAIARGDPHAVPRGAEALLKAADGAAEPVHPHTAPIVQQQLDALDYRQIVWQGLLWPGQAMRWEIEEREARGEDGEAQREWQTRLDLQLPQLGEVGATLRLTPQGVRIEIEAVLPDSVAQLRAAAPALVERLEQADLKVAQLQVAARDG